MNLWPFRRNAKAAAPAFPGGGQAYFLRNLDLQQTGDFDYRRRVGTGVTASVVMAPIQWVQRSMPEAPLIVEREMAGGEWQTLQGHALAALISAPNPHYTGNHLLQATCFSYLTDGNAYWLTLRNSLGRPVQLWYIPHWLIEPEFPDNGSEFLTGYRYRVGGRDYRLDVRDVVHFRHGLDPMNLRRGISPLESVLREVWTDMEAGEFMAALLRNSGVPGLLVSPDGEASANPPDVDEIKKYVMERTTGSHRGEPLVFSGRTKVERLAWNPRDLDLSAVTDRSEERVCALLGIPAAVVGFSAGLEQTKVGATMEEMRRLAWQNGIIPLHRTFAEAVGLTLLAEFRDRGNVRVRFDTGRVEALSENRDRLFTRIGLAVQGGWITVAAGKRAVGLVPEPGDDVYLRSLVVDAVPSGGQPQRAEAAAPKSIESKGTALEERIAATAPRGQHTRAQLAYLRAQDRVAKRLSAAMAKDLSEFFVGTLGKRAEDAARATLRDEPKESKEPDPMAQVAARVLDAMRMQDIAPIFAAVYEAHYLRVATATAPAMEALGLATNLPDPIARAIQATGGTRAGLVDLSQQTRDALFRAIEEGRSLGEGAAALADRIAEFVPAGPWDTAEIRANVIARTETKYAQRVSAVSLGESQGVERFIVFDARLGETDPECERLDGTIVTADEAHKLAADEHPNGTRDFVPYFGD